MQSSNEQQQQQYQQQHQQQHQQRYVFTSEHSQQQNYTDVGCTRMNLSDRFNAVSAEDSVYYKFIHTTKCIDTKVDTAVMELIGTKDTELFDMNDDAIEELILSIHCPSSSIARRNQGTKTVRQMIFGRDMIIPADLKFEDASLADISNIRKNKIERERKLAQARLEFLRFETECNEADDNDDEMMKAIHHNFKKFHEKVESVKYIVGKVHKATQNGNISTFQDDHEMQE
mmetsp:Transcript_7331/g.9326  ORF Transcript_7331/g.9326 Transcript_7331/m.9326 type:complete len:230 (+) Transcript_7331:846-1535(+)